MTETLDLSTLDTKGLTRYQIQHAIDLYWLQKSAEKQTQDRKRRQQELTNARNKVKRLLEKGGIKVLALNAASYERGADLSRISREHGFALTLQSGGSWRRRYSPAELDRLADEKRRLIATLYKIDGLAVHAETRTQQYTDSDTGVEKVWLNTTYYVSAVK